MDRLDIRLDDVAHGPEFGTRVMTACNAWGFQTLRDVKEGLGKLKTTKHFGRKSMREVMDALQWAERPDRSLFEDPEYVRRILEDRLHAAMAILHDAENYIFRAALAGRVSREGRKQVAFKLRDAAAHIEQIPILGEE